MPTILAIETSSELASVALSINGQVFSREVSGVQTHSQTVLPMVQDILVQAGLSLAQCDAVAYGAGPGSFTGVRTACGVVQGLAYGQNLPVIPVVTLKAMAQACREAIAATDVLVVLDARMDEVYWAQYRYQDGWQTISEPTLSPPAAVTAVGKVIACGNGLDVFPGVFEAMFPTQGVCPNIAPHAKQIASLAQEELACGRSIHARDAQPIYLRNKVALTTSERMAKVAG